MEQIKELIEAIKAGKTRETKTIIESILGERLMTKIAERKQEIAESIGGGDQESFIILDESDIEYMLESGDDELIEAAGALAGLPTKVIKRLTSPHYAPAGENSDVEKSGRLNSEGAMRKSIDQGLKNGKHVVVHVNGKFHKAISSEFGKETGTRENFHVHDENGKNAHPETVKGTRNVGTYTYQSATFSKGKAIDHVAASTHGEDFFKNNHVEVHHIGPDAARLKKQNDRANARPDLRDPSGLKKIRTAAAEKLAHKYVPDSDDYQKLKDLHAELGKHIASGSSTGARQTLKKLSDHIGDKGIDPTSLKRDSYVSALHDLKTNVPKAKNSEFGANALARTKRDLARLRER
jgi:hypothetical protein